ncbi:endo-1,4-beta-xylanase 1-like isoform X2 [Zingiber officinale]|uniref:GH10 domain-containing protein n=1 Tax=Zingiber officinale TaxID=94328 RepID=A0A8J5M501_ZINOF|nr:endo-1,4-beta-xylanase 1-like isoform X2 [Zingiber officinale]KAG6534236.1 hypothetical protein ZIOFF_008122 [Zingiber officinale]
MVGDQLEVSAEAQGKNKNHISMCLTAFCCRPERSSSPSNLKSSPNPIEITEASANPQPGGSSFHASGSQELEDSLPSGSEQKVRMSLCSLSGQSSNIVSNHDFSNGLESWHSNCCQSYVASENSNFVNGVKPLSGSNYAVVMQRSENWQGLEQDITDKVIAGVKYIVTVFVSVHGDFHGASGVQATLRIENLDSSVSYVFIERILVSQDCWRKLEGSFLLTSNPRRVVFYLEGPNPGIDLLIDSVAIACEKVGMTSSPNIVSNHDFLNGLESWHPNCCQAYVTSGNSNFLNGVKPLSGDNYAVVMRRSENWQGLEQDITDKVAAGLKYNVTVFVAVHGDLHGTTGVQATLKLENDSSLSYVFIERIVVSQDCWKKLEGSFSLTSKPRRVVFYLEGPDPGIDILIDSVAIVCEEVITYRVSSNDEDISNNDEHIVHNPQFEDGLNNWSGRGCKITLCSSLCNGKILPVKGKFFVAATERSHNWNGIEQEITGRFVRKRTYEVTALVQIFGHTNNAGVQLTLWVQSPNGREQYIGIAKTQASDKEWVQLQGKFLLNGVASRAILFIEGPNPGIDILVDSVVVRRPIKAGSSVPPITEVDSEDANVIRNVSLTDGLNQWNPLGSCKLSICTHPQSFSPVEYSLSFYQPQNKRYILTTNRTETWMGPSQIITNRIKLHITYQVVAWVRLGSGASGPQNVNIALNIDNQWVNGGQVEANNDRWYKIRGSFRVEKKPSKVVVHAQGPPSGVDLMMSEAQILPVNRKTRYKILKEKADKIRKQDIVLKFIGFHEDLSGASLKIHQIENSFPIGACISRSNIENEEFVDFFLKNFNWAVFGNELKWYHTEPQRGHFNYKDADELLDFCQKHGKQTRGHCVFWEVEDAVQPWLRSLSNIELMKAVQNRLKGLLTRYRGMFKHYDVNNEMLHGSFFQDRLGKDIRAYMFREAHHLDPSAVLYVNDYNVEDGCDPKSTPERLIDQILDLQKSGAPVGGIGIQCHISHPVGEIICDALDKLAVLGLPIWLTELDVSAVNEHVRADDLEVVLREAFAHPAIEGVMLWSFWELFTCRDHSHLVNAEGDINEAGKRFLALKNEWLSNADGKIDASGEFKFRGYHGTYSVEISTKFKSISRSFKVEKGDSPVVVIINS